MSAHIQRHYFSPGTGMEIVVMVDEHEREHHLHVQVFRNGVLRPQEEIDKEIQAEFENFQRQAEALSIHRRLRFDLFTMDRKK